MSEPLRYRRREIVRITRSHATERLGLVGLTGTITGVYGDGRGAPLYGVTIPMRRHQEYSLAEDELESTGRFELAEEDGDRVSMRLRVDPGTGEGTLLAENGGEIEVDVDNGGAGVAFFSCVQVLDPDAGEDDDLEQGVIVGKARHPGGEWRYAVLLEDERKVEGHERNELDPAIWLDPREFLDGPRPRAIEEFERSETLSFTAAWRAPRPAFGYDQRVRVLARAYTDAVADREGAVRMQFLSDELSWSYFVVFDHDPGSQVQSATVGEDDLEATGEFGDGYNPPPRWLGCGTASELREQEATLVWRT